MPKPKTKPVCVGSGPAAEQACCSVEAIVTVDERGQMVLPKEIRERSGIKPGEKFALASWQRDGRLCCFTLIRVEDMVDLVKGHLGPIMKDSLK